MKNSTVVWDKETLDAFIMAPQKALPGNIMPFPGIPGEEEHDEPRSSSSRKRSRDSESSLSHSLPEPPAPQF
jgi:hypothetical protein